MSSYEHAELSPMSSPPSPRSVPPRHHFGSVRHAENDDAFVEHADAPNSDFVEHANPDFVEHANPDFVENASPDFVENASPDFVENADFVEHANPDFVEHADEPLRPSMSRRSTIMLDEDEQVPHNLGEGDEEGPFSRAQEGEQVGFDQGARQPRDGLVETAIEWREGGSNVFVTGSFTGWRQMIPLRRFEDNVFVVVLKLAPGTHRLRFVVDGELRCSNYMDTATDSMGNLVNYMEVGVSGHSTHSLTDSSDQLHPGPTPEAYAGDSEYTREIPEIFADPEALDRFSSIDFMPPPQLPPHLDGVILNTNWTEKDNNSVLPIPNHVVLNHLATTSIKHNVLAVASVSRYRAKYVTQILYSPIEGM